MTVKVFKEVTKFAEDNLSTILTAASAASAVCAVVSAVKETEKAAGEPLEGDNLGKKFISGVKRYPKTIAFTVLSIGGSVGAQIINLRDIKTLTEASLVTSAAYDKLQKKMEEEGIENPLEEIIGPKDKEEAIEIEDKLDGNIVGDSEWYPGAKMIRNGFSGGWFWGTEADVERACRAMTELLAEGTFDDPVSAYYNEFLEELGCERTEFGNVIGWKTGDVVHAVWDTCFIPGTHTPALVMNLNNSPHEIKW